MTLDLIALFSPPAPVEPSMEEIRAEINGDAFLVLPDEEIPDPLSEEEEAAIEADPELAGLWGFWDPPS